MKDETRILDEIGLESERRDAFGGEDRAFLERGAAELARHGFSG